MSKLITPFTLPTDCERHTVFIMRVFPDRIQVGAGAALLQELIYKLTERELDIMIRWGANYPAFRTGFLAAKFTPEYPMVAISNASSAWSRGEVEVVYE